MKSTAIKSCCYTLRCVALKIHCSEACKQLLDKLGGYYLEERGVVNMKVKVNLYTEEYYKSILH